MIFRVKVGTKHPSQNKKNGEGVSSPKQNFLPGEHPVHVFRDCVSQQEKRESESRNQQKALQAAAFVKGLFGLQGSSDFRV